MIKAIYKITNIISNKIYIGQSIRPERRWHAHKSRAKKGYGKGKYPLYDAIRKYGEENFTFEVLGWFEDYNEKERYYIQYFNSLIPNGYNYMAGVDEPPHKYGTEHHNGIYEEELVDKIISDLQSGKYTQHQIMEKYQVNQLLVSSINRGITHRKDGISYPIMSNSPYHINKKDIEDIIYLLRYSTCTCAEIGAYYKVTASAIKAINAGRAYYNDELSYPIRNFRGKANSQSVETILVNKSTLAIDTQVEM